MFNPLFNKGTPITMGEVEPETRRNHRPANCNQCKFNYLFSWGRPGLTNRFYFVGIISTFSCPLRSYFFIQSVGLNSFLTWRIRLYNKSIQRRSLNLNYLFSPHHSRVLSFQLWCETTTEASLRLSINDSHCPGRIRLTAVLSNFNEFSRAFNCPAQSKMISENICRIW